MARNEADRGTFRFPVFQGLLPVDRSLLWKEVIAGVTLATLAIPEVMGYTKIAGTPLITGLYTLFIPMILYAVFGASRHMVVAADSATAAILASGIAAMAVPGSAQWLALAGTLALMAAGLTILARILRLGFLADFLSRTALIGFLTGVGIQIAAGEISGMLGLPAAGHGTIDRIYNVALHIDHANYSVAAISFIVLVMIVGLRRISKKIPGPITAVVAAVIASWAFGLGKHGVPLLGRIPGGLPEVGLPDITFSMATIRTLSPTAFAMFVVILTQSAATARAYAFRFGERINVNTDMVGLSLANIGAGLSGTFVVNGSPTKTEMVVAAGGKSQLSQLVTSIIVLFVLLFFTGPLAYMPAAVLSAIVFLIGIELVDIGGMKTIFRERPWEFWVAVITAAAVIFAGVEQSLLLAIIMSLVVHTRHGYRPNNKILISNDSGGWVQHPVRTAQQELPGLLIYRFMHNMYYANAQIMIDEIMSLAKEADPPLAWFCLDAAAANDVDFTAAEALRALHGHLTELNTRLVFCEVTPDVRKEMDRSGITDLVGNDSFFPTPAAVVHGFRKFKVGMGDVHKIMR